MAQTVIRECRNPKCGKEFPTKTSRAVYCSPECNRQYHRDKQSTTLKLQIGALTVIVSDISPSVDHVDVYQALIDGFAAELAKHMPAEPAYPTTAAPETTPRVVDPAYEQRFPVVIHYTDGFVQQANIGRSELATIIGSQRLVGSVLRTVADVN